MSETNTRSALEQLKDITKVVADTGDFELMREYRPLDATTNPSLILKAVKNPEYASVVDTVLSDFRGTGAAASVEAAMDRILIEFGLRILDIVPGRVSTEVDARLSFDTTATVEKARELIGLYEARGISRDRILIKIASTWEGIEAGRILEEEGIRCNMTLLFSLAQAVAAAEAGVQLISPFVGRITDWYKANGGVFSTAAEDPGVVSVRSIFSYYKKFGYPTEVMGASFRSMDQILELAGCDLLTISPSLLGELAGSDRKVERKLGSGAIATEALERLDVSEGSFRWLLNEDAMATQKLAEGIRTFAADICALEKLIASRLG